MKKSNKTILGVLAIGLLIGGFMFMDTDSNTLTGSINKDQVKIQDNEADLRPDLIADIEIIANKKEEDLAVKATFTNNGDRAIAKGEKFTYQILLNDKIVFENTDEYAQLRIGDSFNFTKSISQEMYKYTDEGKLEFRVDTNDEIIEKNEGNNMKKINYKLI